MCFEKEGDDCDTNRTTETTGTIETGDSPVRPVCPGGPVCHVRPVKPLVDSRLHQRVKLRLKCSALLRVGKHFGGDAAALLRIGNQLMNNGIGVESLDAEFVQEFRKERFPAGNPPG